MKHFYEVYGLKVKAQEPSNNTNGAGNPVTDNKLQEVDRTPQLGQQSRRYNIYSWMKTMYGGEYNPSKLSHEDYMDMLRDPQVDTAYSLITDMLLSKKYVITAASEDPQDQEIAEFVQDMLDNMAISMRQVRADLYSAILFGFAVSELVYKMSTDGKIVIDKIRGIDIRTIWDGFVYDDYGDVIEIVQTIWGVASIDPIRIPADKCIIYSRNPMHGNMYGRSDFKSLYDSVFTKSQILRILMVYIQKHGAPTLAGFKGEDGDVEEMQANLDEIMEGRANLVFNSGDDVKVLETAKNGEVFFSAINYLDNMIFRRLKIGSLLLGQAEGAAGSYAQSQTHSTILGIVLDGIHEEMAGLFEKAIRKVVDYNYLTTSYPNFEFEEFDDTDLLKLLEELEPYGKDGLVDLNVPWFKQLLSLIVERLTDIKMDVTGENSQPPQKLAIPEQATPGPPPTVPTNTPVTPTNPPATSTGSQQQINQMNTKLKQLLPPG